MEEVSESSNINSSSSTNQQNDNNEEQQEQQQQVTYNQKWSGYLGIMLSSLVNFASVADISVDNIYDINIKGENIVAIFGAVSFFISLLILAFDRIHVLRTRFDFQNFANGKLEGGVLTFLLLWWAIAVGMMTKAGGIAYNVLNTYFSCWYTLGMVGWTLDKWSASKDIISIHELTRLSETLPYWYILLLVSVVEMGSAADFFTSRIDERDLLGGKREYAIAVGAFSIVVAAFSILAHYKLLCDCCYNSPACSSAIKPGGFVEITVGVITCIWWILAVAILTTDELVASTIQGVGDSPGSNLYLSLWLGLYASVKICLEWKAVHAMKHLHVSQVRKRGTNQLNDQDDNIE